MTPERIQLLRQTYTKRANWPYDIEQPHELLDVIERQSAELAAQTRAIGHLNEMIRGYSGMLAAKDKRIAELEALVGDLRAAVSGDYPPSKAHLLDGAKTVSIPEVAGRKDDTRTDCGASGTSPELNSEYGDGIGAW